jgi:hypothetical protein
MTSSRRHYAQSGYLSSPAHHHRAIAATAVAVICGVIGGAVGLFSLITGQEFDFQTAQTGAKYAEELAYDFQALNRAETYGTGSTTIPAPVVAAPATRNGGVGGSSAAADDAKRCEQGIWPFLPNDCRWGSTAPERHRKRIVSRLESPRCSGLRGAEGAYNCRARK